MPTPTSKLKSQFIKSLVNIHDRTQVETVFAYSLDKGGTEKQPPHVNFKYRVDAFLFFPVQTGINTGNYNRNQFYNDLRAFIRLREPRLSYKELTMGNKTSDPKFSPLQYMRTYCQSLAQGGTEISPGIAIEEARVFGCAYVSYYWRRVERRTRRMYFLNDALANATPEEAKELSERFINNTAKFFAKGYELLRQWRELYVMAKANHAPAAVLSEWELVNEYASYCFRDGLLRILKSVNECQLGFDAQYTTFLKKKISAYLRLERCYARRAGFVWLYDDSEKVLKENYVYRRGALKRRIWSVLYLNPRADLIFRFQKQLGPMFAAGMAAAWALLATLLIWTQSSFRGFQFFGALSITSLTAIAAAFVMSYILKDRIKELGRSWFERGLFGVRPDLANNIYYTNAENQRLKIANVKEFVDFIKTPQIPEEILALRRTHVQRHHRFEDAAGTVIHYSKVIKLWPAALARVHQPVRAVQDILRLNISSYISRLDDPLHMGLVPTKDGRAVETLMPKVYHLDLILRYSPLLGKSKLANAVTDYYRLVVDKKGLSRIEQLK